MYLLKRKLNWNSQNKSKAHIYKLNSYKWKNSQKRKIIYKHY